MDNIKGIFKSIVRAKLYNDAFKHIELFIEENIEHLEIESSILVEEDSVNVELIDVLFKHLVIFENTENDEMLFFKIAVEAELGLIENTKNNSDEDLVYKWFLLNCNATFLEDDIRLKVIEVSEYNKDLKGVSGDFDFDLVPILGNDQYENRAKNFLMKYYPEVYEKTIPLDLAILAERMGVTVSYKKISKDNSVFGQIFFKDIMGKFYNEDTDTYMETFINKGTIIVDPNVFFMRNLGSVTNTIVHEMVHWEYHKKAFLLESYIDNSLTKISSLVRGGVKNYDSHSSLDWMERQANSLAPKILMPLVSFKKKTHELIKYYQNKLDVLNLVDVLELVISDLANFYVVSKISVKLRLYEIGYTEVLGVLNYVDNHYIRPHSFKKDSLEKHQTFTLSTNDALFLSIMNEELREALNDGKYKFIENHFVLNDPFYITIDLFGNPILTEYARMNMDECCLIFDIVISSKSVSNKYFFECILCRDINSNIKFEVQFNAGLINMNDSQVRFEAYKEDVTSLIEDLPNSFAKSLTMVIEWSDMTVEEVAFGAQIEPRTLRRLTSGETTKPKIETVVALCVSMKLPSQISYILLDNAGHQMNKADEYYTVLRMIINGYNFHSIEKCNELLVSNGFKQLI